MELVNFIQDIIIDINNEYSVTNNDYNDVLNYVAELINITHDRNIDYIQYILPVDGGKRFGMR